MDTCAFVFHRPVISLVSRHRKNAARYQMHPNSIEGVEYVSSAKVLALQGKLCDQIWPNTLGT